MSGELEKKSNAASGLQDAGSVFDFLYYDVKRVGAYLGQFDPDGHLTALTKAASATEMAASKSLLEGSGGVPGVANAKALTEDQQQEGRADTATKSYDPLFANALAFLDYATQQNLLSTNVPHAAIGQFVLARGTLSIIDMMMLRSAWEAPAIKKLILDGEPIDRSGMSSAQFKAAKAEQTKNATLAIDMLKLMPHSVQGQMLSDDLLWMTLDSASLTTPVGDLALKHGVTLAGEWYMAGLVDATPDNGASLSLADGLADGDLLAAAAALSSTPIGTIAMALAPFARMFMGRPATAFGVTPLLIFRKVQG